VGAFVALVSWPLGAGAQVGVDDGDYWEEQSAPTSRFDSAANLEEAQQTGQAVVLGGGNVAPRTIPPLHTVRRGDTLWDITGRYFGNSWRWPRVWSYNPEITNPHWIYPLDRIRLVPEGEAAPELPADSPSVRPQQALVPGTIFLRDQGYLDREALETSGQVVGSPLDRMLLTPYDEVYLQFDSPEGIQEGMELPVFREMQEDERNENEQGSLVRVFGTIELRNYDQERGLGRGVVTEALDPIERGFRVAIIPRRFDTVAPRANEVDLQAEVVASLRPHDIMGAQQVLFVNVGSEQGVRPGNRLFVVRRGDQWREGVHGNEDTTGARFPNSARPAEYPDEIVAEGRAINVRPNTTAVLITRAIEEVVLGDRVEMRSGY
jgi:hypothetical protein